MPHSHHWGICHHWGNMLRTCSSIARPEDMSFNCRRILAAFVSDKLNSILKHVAALHVVQYDLILVSYYPHTHLPEAEASLLLLFAFFFIQLSRKYRAWRKRPKNSTRSPRAVSPKEFLQEAKACLTILEPALWDASRHTACLALRFLVCWDLCVCF